MLSIYGSIQEKQHKFSLLVLKWRVGANVSYLLVLHLVYCTCNLMLPALCDSFPPLRHHLMVLYLQQWLVKHLEK